MTETKKDVIKLSFIYFLELILTILSTLAITSVMRHSRDNYIFCYIL